MKRYRWPGNIRELENLVRRLAALYPQEVITEQLVEAELNHELAQPFKVGTPLSKISGSVVNGEATLASAIEPLLAKLFQNHGDQLPPPRSLPSGHQGNRGPADFGCAGGDRRPSDQGS